jgi:hypothetical protein
VVIQRGGEEGGRGGGVGYALHHLIPISQIHIRQSLRKIRLSPDNTTNLKASSTNQISPK